MNISTQINLKTYQNLVMDWGHEPTWNEFKLATECGNVRISKNAVAKISRLKNTPLLYSIVFGYILPIIWMLLIPLDIVAYFTGFIGGWWLLVALAISIISKFLAEKGQIEVVRIFAETAQENYKLAVRAGAFIF